MTPEIFLNPDRLQAALQDLPRETLKVPDVALLRYPWDFVHANDEGVAPAVADAGRQGWRRRARL